jgi:hypothetical protein
MLSPFILTRAPHAFGGSASVGSAPAQVTVTTTSLPGATADSAYSQSLTATGGDGTYTWSVTAGTVPSGTTLSSAGVLSGTPDTAATYNFTVQADDGAGNGSLSTDTQALEVIVSAASSTPDWEEDWDYADTTAMLAGIHEDSTTGAGSISLLTGLTGTPGGFTKALRCAFLSTGSGTDHQVGATLSMGSFASTNTPREIWLQMYTRWSSDWQSTGPFSGGGAGHKHLFLFDQDQLGTSRHSFLTQIGGDSIQMIIAGNYGTGGSSEGLATYPGAGGIETQLFDGSWKLCRYHAKMDGTTGVWEAMIDGNFFHWGTGGDNDLGASKYYTYIALSRNINNGVNQDQELDFGPVEVFTSDPGWTFS